MICIGYLIVAYIYAGAGTTLKLAALLLFPCACIWFPEALGNYTGFMSWQAITERTPAVFVAAAGWFLLVGVPLIVYAIFASS